MNLKPEDNGGYITRSSGIEGSKAFKPVNIDAEKLFHQP
jgi:hypothetical protein